MIAGRGFGKTRADAEYIRNQVETGKAHRIALVAKTPADARDVMIEGDSGILNVSPPWDKPDYIPSKRKLEWKNGATALIFSSAEPDQLRGPQSDLAWGDEIRTWIYPQETWDNLMFGLRLGEHPRCVASTTPSPIPLIRNLLKSPDVVITRGSTYENRANLALSFFKQIISRYEGTRLGRQEIYAELLDDIPGALWTRKTITYKKAPDLKQVVVAIDPAVSSAVESDETGIVVAGKGVDGLFYVLADRSTRDTPDAWARRAIRAYEEFKADRILGETNNGGEMVELTLRTVNQSIPYKAVHASRGKVARAEPISALYEQGKVFHTQNFQELEDQMCIAEGTLITTQRGLVPIEYLVKGDFALTRWGLKEILWSGYTGFKNTLHLDIEKCYNIVATGNHPIYIVGKGFVPVDSIKAGDEVLCQCQSLDHIKNLMESNISYSEDTIGQVPVMVESCYIGQYGNQLTDQPHQAMMSTIKMKTQPTMRLATLNCAQVAITEASMLEDYTVLQPSIYHSDKSMVESLGKAENQPNIYASSAGATSIQEELTSCIVHPALRAISIKSVEKHSKQNVWNLSVKDAPEFFGNGILCHNCTWTPESGKSPDRLDALVWALTFLSTGGVAEIRWI